METITKTYFTQIVRFQRHSPAILIWNGGRRPNGKQATKLVQVKDDDLWNRLLKEVVTDEFLTLTVQTVWPDKSRCYNCLVGFALHYPLYRGSFVGPDGHLTRLLERSNEDSRMADLLERVRDLKAS